MYLACIRGWVDSHSKMCSFPLHKFPWGMLVPRLGQVIPQSLSSPLQWLAQPWEVTRSGWSYRIGPFTVARTFPSCHVAKSWREGLPVITWGSLTQFWLASAVATGLPYRGNSVVGAVGEMAFVKWRKLWKTGEDGLCCSSSTIQTRLGPSSLLEERSGVPIVFVVLLCCRLPPKLGEMAKVYR